MFFPRLHRRQLVTRVLEAMEEGDTDKQGHKQIWESQGSLGTQELPESSATDARLTCRLLSTARQLST